MSDKTVCLDWWGPYSLYEMNVPGRLLDAQGLYVLAFLYEDRYFIHYVGETGGIDVGRNKTFLNRLAEHRYGHMVGPAGYNYCRYDPIAARERGRLPEEIKPSRDETCGTSGFCRFGEAWVKALSVFLAPLTGKTRADLEEMESAMCHYSWNMEPETVGRFHEKHRANRLSELIQLECTFGQKTLVGFADRVSCRP